MIIFQIAFLGMKFLLVFLMLGSLKTNASSSSAAPDWFSDYVKSTPGCDRELLCAVGEAETLADALTEARTEIAKYFQTKIKSKSQMSTTSEQAGTIASKASFDEWTNKVVSTETSELISGLEIKKQEQAGGHNYVLMTLDRSKTAKLLKDKIEELDTENSQMMDLNSRFTYPRILKNLALIELYNDRYTLVAQFPIQLKVKKETVQEKINKLSSQKVSLVTRGRKLPAKLNHIITEIMAPLKIVIVQKKSNPAYTLRGEVITEEQYFKVEGFKKLNVIYKLELLDAKSLVVGKLSTLSEQVARTPEQAIEMALPDIKEALQNNLEQLSSK